MKNISFSIYGGKKEIGGNKILLKYKNTNLMLDFGLSFSQYKKYYSEFLQPRKSNALLDYFEFNLLPKLKGIYREDYSKHLGLKFTEKPSIDALLLSHAHIDHSGLIHFLRKDIPIICTKETYLILKAVEETSSTSFTELTTIKKEFHMKKTPKGYSRLRGEKDERIFMILRPYKKYKFKDVEIQLLPVDHSLPGAAAFIIYTDKGNIVYTGDFRFHGRKGDLTKKFVKIAKKSNPVLMFSEGTRITEKKSFTEQDVERRSEKLINKTKDIVIVNYPMRDLDRLQTFFNIAKNTDRKLVISTKQAYLLKLLEEIGGYPKLKDVTVYIRRKGWGLISNEFQIYLENVGWANPNELEDKDIKRDYYQWEREFLDIENSITYEDIKKNPSKFIFRCDNFELNELIDIKPKRGLYIRSMTEPFTDDMVIEEKRVKNWLRHFHLLPIHQIHASGHANGKEIIRTIKTIQPRKLVPIHTEHPEILNQIFR